MAKKSHQLEEHSEQGTPRHILRGRHALAGAGGGGWGSACVPGIYKLRE